MNKLLDNFISYLEEQAANHSIYVIGAQGQDSTVISEEWIKSREKSEVNANRAIAYWKKQCEDGYGKVLKAFDCSGLGMYFLQNVHKLAASDMTANGMMAKCDKIDKSELEVGDWVFVVYKSGNDKGKAHHVGYIVDDELNVIEAKGRDDGVIKRPFSACNWNAYGRPSCYFAEASKWTVGRVLKVTKPLMKGNDIRDLQKELIKCGYSCGAYGADGVYGSDTAYAVRQFQAAKRLVVDGKAGKYTIAALGGAWRG